MCYHVIKKLSEIADVDSPIFQNKKQNGDPHDVTNFE